MSFAQGLSGLSASASNLDIIGNNIANAGTFGFKAGSVQFSDVYTGSRVGLGTQVASVSQNFTTGAVQTSSRPLDVAIVEGDGFFRMSSTAGDIAYTRNGQFNLDKNGYIVNAAGYQLTGYQVGSTGAVGGGLAALQMPTTAMVPKQTADISAQFNLDSRSTVPTAAFNANDSTTYNYSNSLTVHDSLGNAHELSNFFVKSANGAWDMYATADGYPLDANGAMLAAPGAGGPPAVANSTKLATGALTFNGNGELTTTPSSVQLAGLDFNNGSAPMAMNIELAGTTQFSNDSDVKKLTQDGYASGTLIGFAIGQDGTVTGKYSNEQSKSLGQVVLSSFVNPNGLQPKGDNIWTETAASGQPLTGTAGSGTRLGSLTSGALEASNVDLTSELVNLIIAQRTYQANAQTVKTQDQVVQTLMNMR